MSADGREVAFHSGLGRLARKGSWREQAQSTHGRFERCLEREEFEAAAALARFTIEEAREGFVLYSEWIPKIRAFAIRHGADPEQFALQEQRWLDGISRPRYDMAKAEHGWVRTQRLAEGAARACERSDGPGARAALEASRLSWLVTHDRLCDWVQKVIELSAEMAGEAVIGRLWEDLLGEMFAEYERYDINHTPWAESAEKLLLITAEALRGHLSGPGRRGDLEVIEETDRIGFRFAPCGSGGRNFSNDTYSLFALTQQPYDWAWNQKGTCLYCAHCCAISHINPIRRLGYPARVVEPPINSDERKRNYCTWWVYRDPSLIPETVYHQTGQQKPAQLGAAGNGGKGIDNGK